MRRFCLVFRVAASIALVGCGSATDTVTLTTSSSQTLSLVVSGSSDQVQGLASDVSTAVSQGESRSGVTVATASGDQHQGAMVCTTDVSKNGESFHIAVYSTASTVTSAICSSLDALGS
jgi:hypothetical protein